MRRWIQFLVVDPRRLPETAFTIRCTRRTLIQFPVRSV